MCLLGVLMMVNHIYGSKVPKTHIFGAWITTSSQICEKFNSYIFRSVYQIDIKFDRQLRPATETSWVVSYGSKTILRWRTAAIWKSIYRHISVKNHQIFMKFCTDFELDERHVIKNEKKLHWTHSEFDKTYFLSHKFSVAPGCETTNRIRNVRGCKNGTDLLYHHAKYDEVVRRMPAVWSRSDHTSRVNVQLNSTMRLISGTLRSTPLPSSHGFQCSPTLNRQPYGGRLPLTSWWRKSSNMTVGQSSLIYLAHHCYDWHPGSRRG